MVTLAPVGARISTKQKRNPLHFVEQKGDNGFPAVQQPKLKSYVTDGIVERMRAGKDIEWDDNWEAEPAEPWTGSKLFEVSLPGQPICRIRADDEHTAKGRYNALNGIISTDKVHSVTEVNAVKSKKNKTKGEEASLVEQLDDL